MTIQTGLCVKLNIDLLKKIASNKNFGKSAMKKMKLTAKDGLPRMFFVLISSKTLKGKITNKVNARQTLIEHRTLKW